MQIGGHKLAGPNVEILVIPRTSESGETVNIVFKAKAILDMEPFKKLCPEPQPPKMMKRGIGLVEDVEDKGYKRSVADYIDKRYDWMIIESLKATPDLEWETVDYSNADTWKNFRTELTESGFSTFEIGKIIQCVLDANSLNEDKMIEARKSFLAGVEQIRQQSFSQNGEQQHTASLGHAKD